MGSFVVFFSFFSCVRGTFTSFFDFAAGNSGGQPLTVVLRPPDAAVCVGRRVAAAGRCDGKLTVMDGVTLW